MATQTVTVLFTDLVGSTDLSSRLGPEGTEAIDQWGYRGLQPRLDRLPARR